MAMGRPNRDIEKSTPQIHNTEEPGPTNPGREVPQEWEGVGGGLRHAVQRPKIGTGPDSTPWLVSKV